MFLIFWLFDQVCTRVCRLFLLPLVRGVVSPPTNSFYDVMFMFYMRVAILPNNMHGKGRQKEFLACVSSQWLIGKRREEETTAGLLIYDHGRHHTGQDNGLEHHQRLWCEPLKCYICFFFLVQECPQLHLLSSTLIHVSRMNGMSLARADRIFKVLNIAEQALPKPVAHWIPAEWNVKKIHTHTHTVLFCP